MLLKCWAFENPHASAMSPSRLSVSVDGVQKSYEAYAKAALPPGHPGRSARSRSAPVDFPDFTRGAWKTKCNSYLMDADIDMSKI